MGTVFTWYRDSISGIRNHSASGIDTINEILVNNSYLPIVVTYHDTLTANSCSTGQDVIITVNPKPVLTSPFTPHAICDSNLFSYLDTCLTPGTTYVWSRDTITGIINLAKHDTGFIYEFLKNTTPNPITVIYVDTLKANGCKNYEIISVVVNPKPLLSNSVLPHPICDSALFSFFDTSLTVGIVFTWSRGLEPGISNPPSHGVGNPYEYLVNTSPNPITVIYIDTLTANGCNNYQNVSVDVNPKPLLSCSLTPPDLCDSSLFHYILTSATIATETKWGRPIVTGISMECI